MSKVIFTGYTAKVEGLDSLMRWAKEADPKLKRALQVGIKDAMAPVLQRARANGRYIQDDGTYAESLSVASRVNGAQYVLMSTDPAAGVKEFAKPGATRLVGKSARSSTQRARKRAGLALAPGLREVRVGVPHRANPPRVMIPAVEGETFEVVDRVNKRIDEVLRGAENG